MDLTLGLTEYESPAKFENNLAVSITFSLLGSNGTIIMYLGEERAQY